MDLEKCGNAAVAVCFPNRALWLAGMCGEGVCGRSLSSACLQSELMEK